MCEAVRSMMLLIYANHTLAKLQKIYIPRAFMPQKTLMAMRLIAFGLPASFGIMAVPPRRCLYRRAARSVLPSSFRTDTASSLCSRPPRWSWACRRDRSAP